MKARWTCKRLRNTTSGDMLQEKTNTFDLGAHTNLKLALWAFLPNLRAQAQTIVTVGHGVPKT